MSAPESRSSGSSGSGDVVVVDAGGTKVRLGYLRDGVTGAVCTTFDSRILCVPSARHVLARTVKKYAADNALQPKAVVLGIPGMLDRTNDRITHCNNIPHLQGSGLRRFLSDQLDCPVILEQDIMLQVLGEWRYGAAQGGRSVFGVYFGTGIGSAFLLDGDPHNPNVRDLQAGHIPVLARGKTCRCGNEDCIEAYACGHTLTDLADSVGCPVETLFTERRNPKYVTALEQSLSQFVLLQAYMLATVTTLLKPDTLLIGGGIPQMTDYPRDELIETTRRHLQKPVPAETVDFRWASLGEQAPLHGALALLESAGSSAPAAGTTSIPARESRDNP